MLYFLKHNGTRYFRQLRLTFYRYPTIKFYVFVQFDLQASIFPYITIRNSQITSDVICDLHSDNRSIFIIGRKYTLSLQKSAKDIYAPYFSSRF